MGTSCTLANIGWDTEPECVSGMADLGITNATCEEATNTTGLTSYETEETKSNITQNFYLKHEVEDNIVTASYVCIRYTRGEACIQGGDPSYYGTYDGISSSGESDVSDKNPTGNIAIINSVRNYFLSNEGACSFNDSNANCYNSSLGIGASADGTAIVSLGSGGCSIMTSGLSFCASGS